jgi:hypothetical protein
LVVLNYKQALLVKRFGHCQHFRIGKSKVVPQCGQWNGMTDANKPQNIFGDDWEAFL